MADLTCKGTKKDGTPCKTKVGIDIHGFCRHCRKKEETDPGTPTGESDADPLGMASNPSEPAGPAVPAVIDPADDAADQDPEENNIQDPEPGDEEEDIVDSEESALANPAIAYPNKARCPVCKGTENIVYSTDKDREQQYRVCLVPKKHYPRKLKNCTECGLANPGRKCPECGTEYLFQSCTRCGFPQYNIEPSLTKRWKTRIKKGKKIFATVKCAHPICKDHEFEVELCGNRFHVEGEKV